MHVRVTRLSGSPENIDRTISSFGERTAEVRRLAGWAGTVVAADTAPGRAFIASYWDSEEALTASETAVAGLRSRMAEEQGVEVVSIERYEVAQIQRSQPVTPGTCARIITARIPPDAVAAAEAELRDNVLPVITTQPGFRSAVAAVNRRNGSLFLASSWNSAADREASEAALAPMRQRVVGAAAGPPEVVHCDIAYADIPVVALEG